MKSSFFKIFLASGVLTLIGTACTKDLNRYPTNDVTSESVFSSSTGYRQAFAKVYGSFALTGNIGPAAPCNQCGDLAGIDEGFSDFYRLFWKAQELSTDEAVIAWGDIGIQDFHNMNWSPTNPFLTGLYYRSNYQIMLANEFLRQSTDDKLTARGIPAASADSIRKFRPEVRFLRAYQYWVLMDLFGNPPFFTENDPVGTYPKQIARKDLFTYIESELKAIEPDLAAPRTNEYGRADRGAAWALLARMYLNAQVYTGSGRYADAVTYAKKVIDAGYGLLTNYRWLMLADNNVNNPEFIFTINYDGLHTQGYGGTTFLTHASVGGSMPASASGVGGGWGGIRTTKNIPNLFPDVNGTADQRAEFFTSGQNIEINDQTVFTDGLAINKYRNVKRDGSQGQTPDFADIDMPIFRLGEMYLIYAEATLRGGNGDLNLALQYVNNLRTRANAAQVTSGQLTIDFMLDERARELYWEGFRRTDLVRYGKFTTTNYLWPWKGGVKNGTSVADFRNLYPIPSTDVTANPNLTQNTGY
jgi:hypothetical protein